MSTLQPIEVHSFHAQRPANSISRVCGNGNAAIERKPWFAFGILSVFYFIVVFNLSFHKLLWLDELITLHIARLGSIGAIWAALSRGADPNPPITHILVHFSRVIFGDHEFAYRLPAAIGYWVGLLSLFLYLKSRLSAVWALVGVMMSMCMAAFDYSYESRSYGIFYGLAMLAFLCWCSTNRFNGRDRFHRVCVAGMTFALAAGVTTNYFAVVAFLPIAAGELTRTYLRLRRSSQLFDPSLTASRRIVQSVDLSVWAALIMAATPLLALRKLIAHSIAQFAPYAWNKASMQQVSDSYTQMVEIILYPILALFAVALLIAAVRYAVGRLCNDCQVQLRPRWLVPFVSAHPLKPTIPVDEMIGVIFLMAYPLLGYAIASIRGGMLSPRFVIPVCFGFAIAATLTAFRLFRHLPAAGLFLLSFLTLWFMARESYVAYWYEEQKQCFYKVTDTLPQAANEVPADAPIAIPDPLLALTFQHYAPKGFAARVVFPIDFPAIRFFRHDDSPEENLWAGRSFLYTLPIVPIADFEHATAKYLIIAGDGNWMLQDLDRNRYDVNRLPINTRAAAMGGFTPIARGTPVFYTAWGDRAPANEASRGRHPQPFQQADNLPTAGDYNPVLPPNGEGR